MDSLFIYFAPSWLTALVRVKRDQVDVKRSGIRFGNSISPPRDDHGGCDRRGDLDRIRAGPSNRISSMTDPVESRGLQGSNRVEGKLASVGAAWSELILPVRGHASRKIIYDGKGLR